MPPVMPDLRHQLHAPEDRADSAEDVGGERDVFLCRHNDDKEEERVESSEEDFEWKEMQDEGKKGRVFLISLK